MPVQVKPMIAEAFIRLSKQKNIDKITVKDLVEACGISRQTFYYHFQDILEVIEWSLDQAFSHLLEQSLAADDPEAVLRGFLETSEESAELLQKLLHSQKREQVERLLVRSVRTYLKEVIERRGPVPGLSYEDMDTALSFCTYGVVGLLLESCEKKSADRARRARQMHRELQALWQDCRERELQMRESVRESRSPAVAALSQVQLTYELEVQRILRDELPAYLHGENTCRDADRAEAASLYGEYAIDFAAQAVRHALLAALSAIDLQMSCDETNQSQSPNETEESV